jgi:hypothetical protein
MQIRIRSWLALTIVSDSFAENRPEKMRKIVSEAGYTICEEDLRLCGIAALSDSQYECHARPQGQGDPHQ